MKCFRKFICFSLATIVMCTAGQPVFASNNEDSYTQVGEINDIEMPDDSAVNYTRTKRRWLVLYKQKKLMEAILKAHFIKLTERKKF